MRIISSVEGGEVRGFGAGGTKGAGCVSMKCSAIAFNVVTGKAGVHVAERQGHIGSYPENSSGNTLFSRL
jgi:hypothetical protein